jgi:archaellum biogenesis ATPase FlaH
MNNDNSKEGIYDHIGRLEKDKAQEGIVRHYIGRLMSNCPVESWEEIVWPATKGMEIKYNIPYDEKLLRGVYESVGKVIIENKKKKGLHDQKDDDKKSITHGELMTKVYPEARFTINPFFEQGTLNMVSAPPNGWKSWLFFLFAYHIATGSPVVGEFETMQTNVMIINEEDSERLIQDRMKALRVTDQSLPIFYRISKGSKLDDKFVDNLLAEVKEKNVGVIMFDSLRSIHEAEENDSTAMQGVMDQLKRFTKANITVIFTHHNRKKAMFGKGDDAEASRGSTAINAAVSGYIQLEEGAKDEEKTTLIVKHLKSKVGKKIDPFEIEIQFVDNVASFSYQGDHKPKEKALSEAKNRILSELQGRTELLSRKDLKYLKVGGDTTIKEATKALVKEGKIREITRKEADKENLTVLSPEGKSNEKHYKFIEDEEDFGIFGNATTGG